MHGMLTVSSSADPGAVWTAATRGSCWRSSPACRTAIDAAYLCKHVAQWMRQGGRGDPRRNERGGGVGDRAFLLIALRHDAASPPC